MQEVGSLGVDDPEHVLRDGGQAQGEMLRSGSLFSFGSTPSGIRLHYELSPMWTKENMLGVSEARLLVERQSEGAQAPWILAF